MQTAVETRYPIGIAGQLADLHTAEFGDVVHAVSEEASAEIPFGVMVKQGTADDGVLLLSANDDNIKGIVVHGHHFSKPVELGDTGLKPGISFGILRKGRIFVVAKTNVTPASEVHVRAVVAGAEVKGEFRGTSDGTDTIDITGFAKWVTSASSGEVAILEIDMSQSALATADS